MYEGWGQRRMEKGKKKNVSREKRNMEEDVGLTSTMEK